MLRELDGELKGKVEEIPAIVKSLLKENTSSLRNVLSLIKLVHNLRVDHLMPLKSAIVNSIEDFCD